MNCIWSAIINHLKTAFTLFLPLIGSLLVIWVTYKFKERHDVFLRSRGDMSEVAPPIISKYDIYKKSEELRGEIP